VDTLLAREGVDGLENEFGRDLLLAELRGFLDDLRADAVAGRIDEDGLAALAADAPARIRQRLQQRTALSLRRVINATGVVVHTNLGRAPLAPDTARRVAELASTYSNLEYDIDKGRRGSRNDHFCRMLAELAGAEAGTVVNNNAGAVLLALNSLSEGRETIVSRGELVEIGGSFRIPDVMGKSGALLREVGTTNRTHLHDYERAIGPETGLLLKVHGSNYRIVGFTREVPLDELVKLGRERGLPTMYDLGSGSLVDLRRVGIPDEPTVAGALAAGADLVTFSGDKLLGGPQAGFIVGSREAIDRVDANPLKRALRVDKMTIAALEATFLQYLTGKAEQTVPAVRMILMPAGEVRRRARLFVRRLRAAAGERAVDLDVVQGSSRVGGGAAPEMDIPTWLAAVRPTSRTPADLERQLRRQDPPVVARVHEDRVVFDFRTVLPGEDKLLATIVAGLC
jgi:L-seryl-tRNA(Ser) seleniumtransferase